MSANFNQTEIEQKILNEVRQMLGTNLANYLLFGLGETKIVHCRAFTALGAFAQAEKVTYRFEVRNESGQMGLPSGRDPLVLAALIDLLWERQPLDSRITFKDSDIMEKLRWPLTPESQTLIRQALERYFLAAYYLIDPGVNGDDLISGKYASSKRLLIGYETTSTLLPVKRTTQQKLMSVQFLPGFSYDTLSESKRFLGVDFQGLREMREISC